MYVLDEIVAYGMGASQFIHERVKPRIAEKFAGLPMVVFIDPAGAARAQTDMRTVLDVLREAGFQAHAARGGNAMQERIRSVDTLLTGQVGGRPMLLIDPQCYNLITGLQSAYRFHEVRTNEIDKRSDDGRRYSHIVEALHYAAMHVTSGRGAHGMWLAGSVREPPRVTPLRGWYG